MAHSIWDKARWWVGKPYGLWLSGRAYRWARAELASVHKTLRVEGVRARSLAPPARVVPRGYRGVERALTTVRPTCLERALVLQAWLTAAGDPSDVVIGVRKGGEAIEAHAWVDGADPDPLFDATYVEITRLHP